MKTLSTKLKLRLIALFLISLISIPAFSVDYEELAKTGTDEEVVKALKTNNTLYREVFGSNREPFFILLLKEDRSYDVILEAYKAGCEVTTKTKDKKTSLMYAAQYCSDSKVIEYIITKASGSKKGREKFILLEDSTKQNAFDYSLLNEKNNQAYSILSKYAKDAKASVRDFSKIFNSSDNSEVLDDNKTEIEQKETPTEEPIEEQIITEQPKKQQIFEEAKPEPSETKQEEITVQKEIVEEPVTTLDDPITIPEVTTYAQTNLYDYILNPQTETEEEEKKIEKIIIENPNKKDENGVSLLMKACKNGNDWEVRTLIENGAEVNTRDKDGWTPLMYAVRYQNNISIINTLIENGAHIRVRNNFNTTPLIMAAQYSQNPDVLKILLKDRTISENEVYNAFILAVSSNIGTDYIKTSKVKLFIDMDIPLNGTWKGMSPLMYACQYSSSTSVIKLLLDNGARTSSLDADGKRAFDYAKANKNLTHDEIYWSLNNNN